MSGNESPVGKLLSREAARFQRALVKALADVTIPNEIFGSNEGFSTTFDVGVDGAGRARMEARVYHPGQWPVMKELDRKRIPSTAVVELLSALHEALALPLPDLTPGDEKEHGRLAAIRLCNVIGILAAAMDEPVDEDCLKWAAGAVRRSIAQNPVTYTAFPPTRKD